MEKLSSGFGSKYPKEQDKNTHVMLQVPQFSGNVLVRVRTPVDVSRRSCRVQIWIGQPLALTYRLSFVLVVPLWTDRNQLIGLGCLESYMKPTHQRMTEH